MPAAVAAGRIRDGIPCRRMRILFRRDGDPSQRRGAWAEAAVRCRH